MELYMVCVLMAIALGILMFKGVLFVMFLMYPLPGKDLKWKRAPSLPMQELSRKFGRGGKVDRPRMPPRPPPPQPPGKSSRVTSSSREKIPSHHEERIPMESMAIEEDIMPMRVGTRYPREIRVPFGTVV